SDRNNSKRRGDPLAKIILTVNLSPGLDETAHVPSARIVMRPMNHAVVTFVLTLERYEFAFGKRNGTRDADVVLDPYRHRLVAQCEPFVFSRARRIRSEQLRNRTGCDHFLGGSTAR